MGSCVMSSLTDLTLQREFLWSGRLTSFFFELLIREALSPRWSGGVQVVSLPHRPPLSYVVVTDGQLESQRNVLWLSSAVDILLTDHKGDPTFMEWGIDDDEYCGTFSKLIIIVILSRLNFTSFSSVRTISDQTLCSKVLPILLKHPCTWTQQPTHLQ